MFEMVSHSYLAHRPRWSPSLEPLSETFPYDTHIPVYDANDFKDDLFDKNTEMALSNCLGESTLFESMVDPAIMKMICFQERVPKFIIWSLYHGPYDYTV